MFDDLFIKSVKDNIKVLPNKKFTERHSDKFQPREEREVRVYSEQVLKSKKNHSLKFTNFLPKKATTEVIIRLYDLRKNPNIVRELDMEPVTFSDKRIEKIIRLFIDDFEQEDLEDEQVAKVTMKDTLGKTSPVRVYFIFNHKLRVYEIILIDLYHLVIPSKHPNKKGKLMSKERVLEKNYRTNEYNNVCISKYLI